MNDKKPILERTAFDKPTKFGLRTGHVVGGLVLDSAAHALGVETVEWVSMETADMVATEAPDHKVPDKERKSVVRGGTVVVEFLAGPGDETEVALFVERDVCAAGLENRILSVVGGGLGLLPLWKDIRLVLIQGAKSSPTETVDGKLVWAVTALWGDVAVEWRRKIADGKDAK